MLFSGDLGNGYIKCRSSMCEADSYRSVISVVSTMLGNFKLDLSRKNHDLIIGFEGKTYAVGETVETHGLTPVNISHRSRIKTDYYRVLFASALARTIWEDCAPDVVLSLPPAAYWDRDVLKAALSGTYVVEIPSFKTITYEIPPEHIKVIPEGVGAVCLLVLDEKGYEKKTQIDLANLPVGIIDIGTYTTDFIQLDSLRIVRRGCDSLQHALHDVHQKLRAYCQKAGYDLDAWQVDRVLNQGWFMLQGEKHYFTDQIDNWFSELVPAISGQVRTLWNGGDDVAQILITGGGSLYTYDMLAMEFPHLRIVEEGVLPHLVNCEGGYRWGLLRERAR